MRTGSIDRIELGLYLMGKEVVHLNGEVIKSVYNFRMKSIHEVTLSDGRIATIVVGLHPGSATLTPFPVLRVGEVEIPPLKGRTPPKLKAAPPPRPLTSAKKGILVLSELVFHSVLIACAIAFWRVSHQQTLLPDARLQARQAVIPLWFFMGIEALALFSRVRLWQISRKAEVPFLDALFRDGFERYWRGRLARRTMPLSGNAILVTFFLYALLCLAMGTLLPLAVVFQKKNATWEDRISLLFVFLLFNGAGLWLGRVLWKSARESRRLGIPWAEAADQLLNRRDEERVEKASRPDVLVHTLKLTGLILVVAIGLYVSFGISPEAKASFLWHHKGLERLFFVNGLVTFGAAIAGFNEFLFFAPNSRTNSSEPAA